MSTRTKGLQRGARATFYRDGAELHSACDIPTTGAFAVRHLPPGQWVCRDGVGGEQAFSVQVGDEHTVLLEGDVVGVTGAPGQSGSAEIRSRLVGPGGGSIRTADQVADETNTAGLVKHVPGETPAEKQPGVGRAERPTDRPQDPGSEERVPGQAGASIVQEVPVRSVADTVAEARRRGELGEEERVEEELESERLAAELAVPRAVAPDEQGPEPDRPTLPAGYVAPAE